MVRISSLPLVPVMLAAAIHAAEVTVEHQDFLIHHSFPATALPDQSLLFMLDAEIWTDFKIKSIMPHGSRVVKGDLLLAFDTESIDHKRTDSRTAVEVLKLELAQLELDLKHLKDTSQHNLDALKRSAAEAKEANTYFKEIRRKADEEKLAHSLKRYRQQLENASEELRQLTKMYEADDLTEETEEIILTRQKNAVESAEFALRMEMLDQKRTLEVLLPREAIQLAEAERDSALLLSKAELEIPLTIQLKEHELESRKLDFARQTDSLEKLERDRRLFEFKAPDDGWFYHGAIEHGRWSLGDLSKTLIVHGTPPLNKPLTSFISSNSKLTLNAFLDEAITRSIGQNKPTAIANLAGRDDLTIPLALISLDTAPNAEGQHRARFEVEWPAELTVVPGATATVRVMTYHSVKAIVLPQNAFSFGTDGWTVSVMLADGKTERRKVTRGRVFNEQVEVINGLEPGQVILLP